MNNRLKDLLSFFLRFGVSGGLLVVLFIKNRADIEQIPHMLKTADLMYIFYAAALFLLTHVFLLLRWYLFIQALKLKVPIKSVTISFFIGLFFNLSLPTSTGGDVVKAFFLFKDTPEKAKVIASVVADRLCGFISICFVALISFLFGYRFIDNPVVLIFILTLAFVSLGILGILFSEKVFSFCCRIFGEKVKEKIMKLHYSIVLLKDEKSAMIYGVILSCCSQIVLAFTWHLIAKAFHHEIPIIYFLVFVPIVCVVSSLPSIAGLGVRDWGAKTLFAMVGVAESVSISITLMNFLFMVIVGLAGGVVYVLALSPRRVQHYPSDAGPYVEKT